MSLYSCRGYADHGGLPPLAVVDPSLLAEEGHGCACGVHRQAPFAADLTDGWELRAGLESSSADLGAVVVGHLFVGLSYCWHGPDCIQQRRCGHRPIVPHIINI